MSINSNHIFFFLMLIAMSLSINFESRASTAFYAGSYSRDLIWTTDSADTVVVNHNTVVQGQNSILIEEGVVVLVRGRLTCSRFKAKGSSARPIRILRAPNASFSSSVFEVNQRQGRDTASFRYVRFDTIQLNLRSDISYFNNCEFFGRETRLNAFDDIELDSCFFTGSESSYVISASGDLQLTNSEFIGNGLSSTTLYNVLRVNGSGIIENNQFLNNTSCVIFVSSLGEVDIRNNTFKGNHSVRPSVYLASPASGVSLMSFVSNVVDSNIARDAGAMFIQEQVRGEFSHNTFSRNTSKRRGGAIYTTEPIENFHANTIINNVSYREGGGICMDGNGGIMMIKSCLIANNTASSGGGIYHNSLDVVVVNSTIVNNSDTLTAGGVRTRGVLTSGLDIYNSIVYGNTSINGQDQIDQIAPPFNVVSSNVAGGYTGPNNFDANPLFVNPTGSAGSLVDARSADWTLDDCNSPCINTGDKDTLVQLAVGIYDFTSDFDLNGDFRITRGQIDVGAFEADGNNEFGGYISNPICSSDSLFSAKAAFSTNGTPSSISWQIDTGNGVWTTIIPIITPGISINFDTLIATNLPRDFGNANYRTISNYSCFSDTSEVWSPGVTPVTFSSENIEICGNDSVFLQGAWRRQSGVFYDTLVNAGGCDSIHTSNLTVYPSYEIDIFDTICEGGSYNWNGNIYTTPGDFFASFTTSSPLSCDSNVSLHLAKFPVLFSATVDTIDGCLGDTVSLDLSDPNLISYRWTLDGSSFDTGAVFSWVPTNFWERAFVTVTDVNGCETSATRDFLEIQLDPYAPQADFSRSPFVDFSFAVGPPANASGYYWSFGDGDTSRSASVIHEYTSNGNYEYCLVIEYTCGLDSACNSIDINNVGEAELQDQEGILLFPNPVKDELHIEVKGDEQIKMIRLYDAKGVLVHTAANKSTINMESLGVGVYFIEIQTQHKLKRFHVLKD